MQMPNYLRIEFITDNMSGFNMQNTKITRHLHNFVYVYSILARTYEKCPILNKNKRFVTFICMKARVTFLSEI